ncbi:hypothetical protein DPMN_088909 [Dreissena polymorpha]|uniref:Uncharacterized protein n=1 Tax=Dreissena polymorpha TaxID=45954 RepID=A0A9D4KVE2_DREPO|nr:hypothetical protein DPMN_088909 [Dreissena polymorpha]
MIDIGKPVAVFLKTFIFIPTQYQKALTLDEVESCLEMLKSVYHNGLLEALCIVTQRMKTDKLCGQRLKITCENIELEGVSSIATMSFVKT